MTQSTMPGHMESEFLYKLKEVILSNISNEQFGVSELAAQIGMSRSNLLRRVQKETNKSVSQFIREIRLTQAMELLKSSSLNVTEVSYEVGFNSTSYFVKCFHDYFGFPPGEAGKGLVNQSETHEKKTPALKNKAFAVISTVFFASILVLLFIVIPKIDAGEKLDKSIAVLPFKNDSADSSNVYLIYGLMEATLNNLQKIKDLRVVSRTSVEKYRKQSITVPEIYKELNVKYLIEGSGQKIGNEILLNIQLIEAGRDKHLWAKQYKRKTEDIFNMQIEIAKNIADEIEAIITPEEDAQISKAPTNDILAYDHFLKGLDLMFQGSPASVGKALGYFRQAIQQDPEFARAYAAIAISYYLLDALQMEKQYSDSINDYADKALLFDAKLAQSLVAKAFYYMNSGQNKLALPFLEKALEYNPNSALVINILSDFYTSTIPNTGKYLEYALKGIKLDIASNDSTSISYIYLHLSNALIQTGFVKEAEYYINKSLSFEPDNLYSAYVKAYIMYAKNLDLEETKSLLISALEIDPARIDIIQEVGKIYYFMRDYDSAYNYYRKFLDIKKALHLNVFIHENSKIGNVLLKTGHVEEAEHLFEEFKYFAEQDVSIYRHLNLAMCSLHQGDPKKALEEIKLFSQEDNYHYWTVLFLDMDPIMDPIVNSREFKETMKHIENKFWESHNALKKVLKDKELI